MNYPITVTIPHVPSTATAQQKGCYVNPRTRRPTSAAPAAAPCGAR